MRYVKDVSCTRRTMRMNTKLIDQCNGQFNKANLLHRVYGDKNASTDAVAGVTQQLSHFHALGKVLYNKTLPQTKTPENSPFSIVNRQPASFAHFNSQLVKQSVEFNKDADLAGYAKLTESISSLDLPIAPINREALQKTQSTALTSSFQTFSSKNVSGSSAAFRKTHTVDPNSTEVTMANQQNSQNQQPTKVFRNLEDRIKFRGNHQERVITAVENFKFTQKECEMLIESDTESDDDMSELNDLDLSQLEASQELTCTPSSKEPSQEKTENSPKKRLRLEMSNEKLAREASAIDLDDFDDIVDLDMSFNAF